MPFYLICFDMFSLKPRESASPDCKGTRWLILAVMIVLPFSGCGGNGDTVQRRAVQGEVAFNGAPIEHGEIRFLPETPGPVATGVISQGKYSIPSTSGVLVGHSRVEIVSSPALSNYSADDISDGPPLMHRQLPEKYNSNSTLREEIPNERGPLILNFQLID